MPVTAVHHDHESNMRVWEKNLEEDFGVTLLHDFAIAAFDAAPPARERDFVSATFQTP